MCNKTEMGIGLMVAVSLAWYGIIATMWPFFSFVCVCFVSLYKEERQKRIEENQAKEEAAQVQYSRG